MAHTPGSWQYNMQDAVVISAEGTICRLSDCDDFDYQHPLITKKNGALLAAAPDMKNLLLKIRGELAKDPAIWEAELINEIDALIAKAEGAK